ncbi:protein hedgehog-like [Folsomia candida]|nr:protein hedgehog-like [Folsomia candida]
MKGKDTGFVKSLQILKKQNLVDNKHPNLILVGTHAAGLGLKPEKYIQNTNRIQKLVKELVLENVGINDVPVVFVENLPEDFNLDKPGDFFLLPDDSLNHANLLQEMFNLFTKTNDTLCRLLVSWYFSPTCPDRDDDPEVDTENESIELGVEAAEQLKEINQLMMDLNIGVKPIPSETVQDETHRGTQTVKAATEVKDTKAQSPTTAASPTATIAIIQPTTRIGMSSAGITTAKQTPTNESSCFPSWTRIVTKTGPKFMHELQVGEHLITMTHNGGQRWSQCYGFAHHDSNRVSKFLKLRLSNGYTLTVTEDHLMIICNEVDVLKYKTARYIKEGDVLFCQNGFVNIIKIGEEICSGVYCPLTTDGTLLADGVLVTCYADTDNFHLAHAAFAPLRIWYKLTGSSGTIGEGGIHKYAKSLMKIRNCFMPAKLQ